MKGHVTWKYIGSGDDEDGSDDDEDAALLLKRLVKKNGKQSVSAELTLAEISHGPSSDEFATLQFDLKPDNNPDNKEFWETCGEGKVMSALNYNLDLQKPLQPCNCLYTHTHTHTHSHSHTPHRAGILALYYYAGDSESKLTFQDVHVEATVHGEGVQLPPPYVEAAMHDEGVQLPPPYVEAAMHDQGTPPPSPVKRSLLSPQKLRRQHSVAQQQRERAFGMSYQDLKKFMKTFSNDFKHPVSLLGLGLGLGNFIFFFSKNLPSLVR